MNTTSRAQYLTSRQSLNRQRFETFAVTYAAAAARSSCLLAFVNNARAAENKRVAISKIPIHMAFVVALVLLNVELI